MADELLDRFNTLLTRIEGIADEITKISDRLDRVEARSDLADLRKVDMYEMKRQMWNDSFGEDDKPHPCRFLDDESDENPLGFLKAEISAMKYGSYTLPKK